MDLPPEFPSRRDFVVSSSRILSGGWLTLQLPAIATLAACSREAAVRGEPYSTLTSREGEVLAAFADTVLPPDDLPGAAEAGVVHFMDGALAQLFPGMLDAIRPGVEMLDRIALKSDPASGGFARLAPDARAAVVAGIEDTPFFAVARMLTVMGMFSDPAYGGNRDHVGWTLLGVEHAPAWEPPFGHYDAEYPGEVEG